MRQPEMIAVHKIGVRAGRRARRAADAPPAVSSSFHPICGIFSAESRGLDRHHLAVDPAEAVDGLEFATALCHQLHADADPEERARADHDRLIQRRFETGNRGEAAPAVGKGADPGEDEAVGARQSSRARWSP